MCLMTILKYLMGQFFFLMARFRAVNTFGHHDRYEVKGLTMDKVLVNVSSLALPPVSK